VSPPVLSRLSGICNKFNPTTLPNQDVLTWNLGAKFSRKLSRFICRFSCCSFGRYRGLGKVESHLQGVLRGDTRTRTTCTLNVQQNSSNTSRISCKCTCQLIRDWHLGYGRDRYPLELCCRSCSSVGISSLIERSSRLAATNLP
jgi:hypothetical protein